jgi:SAM-dependent methyltransferase
MTQSTQDHPASFRDPDARVTLSGGRVLRRLSPDAWALFSSLFGDGHWEAISNQAPLIGTWPHRFENDRPGFVRDGLEHEPLKFQSYPWEWSFEMRRQAALATLDLQTACLTRGFILKDGTALNLAWHKGRMVWIDATSLAEAPERGVWDGYAQFCRTQLYPLMIEAYRGVDPRAMLLAKPDGIPASQARAILGPTSALRRGVLQHVTLQAQLERRVDAAQASKDARKQEQGRDLRSMGLSRSALIATAESLKKLVRKLPPPGGGSVWGAYAENTIYSDAETGAKETAVDEFCRDAGAGRIVDLGCNTGRYSAIAAGHARDVIAIDIDGKAIDRLVTQQVDAPWRERVYPLVGSVSTPSPGHGWRNAESAPLIDRLKGDAFIALALIHHVCIGENVPISGFLDLLADIAPQGVVEWVDKADPMVAYMLRHRRDVFPDYNATNFRALAERRFVVDAETPVSPTRVLFRLTARG